MPGSPRTTSAALRPTWAAVSNPAMTDCSPARPYSTPGPAAESGPGAATDVPSATGAAGLAPPAPDDQPVTPVSRMLTPLGCAGPRVMSGREQAGSTADYGRIATDPGAARGHQIPQAGAAKAELGKGGVVGPDDQIGGLRAGPDRAWTPMPVSTR